MKSFSYVFGFTENPFQYVGGDAHICPRAVIFWGSHVKTVRRNSLVPRCPPGACQRRLPIAAPDMLGFMAESLGPCRRRYPHRPADLPEDSNFLGQPYRNRPAEFARSSLSACGLPTPLVALACTCSVGSLRCHLCRRPSFLNTAFASLQL